MKQTDLEKLLADMSLKEKVDQMLQLSGAFYLGDENSVLTGPANDMGIGKEDLEMAGSILGAAGADTMKKLQDDYMAKQPHHIPMLFMMDVIHGMKTIFPAPLAQGRYAHFVDRAFHSDGADWGVFSLSRLARTPEFRQAAA